MYIAITFDTSALEQLEFDNPLLNVLCKYIDCDNVSLVLSKIVKSEWEQHIDDWKSGNLKITRTASDGKEKTIQISLASKLTQTLREHIKQQILDIGKQRKSEFEAFIKNTLCEIIECDNINAKQIIDLYFDKQPPFGDGKKKSEFPDAIAIKSLEKWAAESDTRIIAITHDSDWQHFASEHFQPVCSIADAIKEIPRPYKETPIGLVTEFLNSESITEKLIKVLYDKDSYFYISAESPYSETNVELDEIEYENVIFNTSTDIEILEQEGDGFVVLLNTSVESILHLNCSFAQKDSIDRDYIGMGSQTIKDERDIPASFVLGLRWDKTNDKFELISTQLEQIERDIDIGYIEPNYPDACDCN